MIYGIICSFLAIFSIYAQPLISLLVPLKQADTIRTFNFLNELSHQTMASRCELVVLDCTSSDEIYALINSFHDKFEQFQCLRIATDYMSKEGELINFGLSASHGEYIALLNPLDRYNQYALQLYYLELIKNTDQDLIYGDYYEVSSLPYEFRIDQETRHIKVPERQTASLSQRIPYTLALWRRALHERYGYFRQDLQKSALWEFINRVASRGAVCHHVSEALVVHAQNDQERAEIQAVTDDDTYQVRGEKPMVIVIPSYNNAHWCVKNLESVFKQKYTNYRIIYIDDASTDGTGDIVERYVQQCNQTHRVTIIHNSERRGAGANKYKGAQLCKDDEIYVDLDGDDWFAHEHVLAHLNKVYANPDVWVTYGQFIYYPIMYPGWAGQLAPEIIASNTVRNENWVTTALRTFYAGLFKQVKEEDMMVGGAHMPMASDLAFMFCIMEMAGHKSVFIPEVLYVYNVNTNLNDGTVNRELQKTLGWEIRKKKPYERVDSYLKDPKKVYITPGLWGDLFAIDNPTFNRDDCLQPTYQMRAQLGALGYTVEQVSSAKGVHPKAPLLYFDVPSSQAELQELIKHPHDKRILFLWEPPSVIPHNFDTRLHALFNRVYTWADDLIDNKKYFKLHYPIFRPMLSDIVPFEQKKLCTMIACNKHSRHPQELYTERRNIIDFFEQYHPEDFVLYGRGWNPQYKTYQGSIEKKEDYLKLFKFCICYENMKGINGYVTEKIFDAMRAGCVPIYLGAPNIAQYVPSLCFIDRRNFASDKELYQYIKTMTPEMYQQYIDAIHEFLTSDQAKKFSIDHFVRTVTSMVVDTYEKTDHEPFYFVTAANAGYFDALLNLLGGIHKHNFDQLGEIAVFDLGLTQEQRTTLKKIQKVQLYDVERVHEDILRPFNTRTWGKPVPGWYAWKPVIIKQALDMFPTILYIDAGTTVYKPLDDLFAHIKQHGYFLHNGSPWHLAKETTQHVINAFDLHSPEKKWLLEPHICGLEAGFMGLTRNVYDSFVKPMYELAKYHFDYFADDGTAPGGLGNSRHDLTLFSIYALLNGMHIYHHFEKPRDDMFLETKKGRVPFHIACNPEDRTNHTHIYASRLDSDLVYFKQFIRWKS